MINAETVQELPVTFIPQLYLQRRRWVFERMTREGVNSVVDIGCGEGETLTCLCNPAPWRAPLAILPDPDSGGAEDTLHITSIHALDISTSSLSFAAKAVAQIEDATCWMKHIRWEPLDVKLWHGGLESFNREFVGVDCIVSTEVIEHLPDDVLPDFAPMLLGAYHPRLLLITTPSYTFNARFTAPDAPESARSGYKDPTGRTNRIFRHSDHKFEWTPEEFAEWCQGVALEWGYEVEISGVGKAQEKDEWGRDEELGWASQVAAFRRRDDIMSTRMREEKCVDVLKNALTKTRHQAAAQFSYKQHSLAGRPDNSASGVSNCIKIMMQKYQQRTATIHEYWFEEEVSTQCGGLLQRLVLALESDEDLLLHRRGRNPLDWVIEFTGLICHTEDQAPVDARTEEETSDGRTDEKGIEEPALWPDRDASKEIASEWRSASPAGSPGQWGAAGWGRSRTPEDWSGWGTEDWRDKATVEAQS